MTPLTPTSSRSEYLSIAEIQDRYKFPTYKAAHEWLRRRRHLIRPYRAGRLLYSVTELERLMRPRRRSVA